MKEIDPKNVITIHAVYLQETTGWMDVHSHGLDKFGHQELQIHCTTLLYREAAGVINQLAHYLLNNPEKKKFGAGEEVHTDFGHHISLVQGDEPDQLRIEGISPKCEKCNGNP